jgi:deoxyadenosine/deoxycytidine kinase
MIHAHRPALDEMQATSSPARRGAFLAVAGNLGVGKTTLVELVTRATGFEPHYELAEENPYLARFYADMRAWGFHSQLFFLVKRSEQHRRLAASLPTAVQDRTIYEDAEIWARNLYERGQIADEDYHLYCDLYAELCRGLPAPDLVLYLAASTETLKQRITARGRSFEAGIETTYVERLNRRYEEWATAFDRCPLIRLETDEINLVDSPQDRAAVLHLIAASLNAARADMQWPATLNLESDSAL